MNISLIIDLMIDSLAAIGLLVLFAVIALFVGAVIVAIADKMNK